MSEINQGGGQPQSLPAVIGNLGVLAAGTARSDHLHPVEDIAGIDIDYLAGILDKDACTVTRTWRHDFADNADATVIGTATRTNFDLVGVVADRSPYWLSVDDAGATVAADGSYLVDYWHEVEVLEGMSGRIDSTSHLYGGLNIAASSGISVNPSVTISGVLVSYTPKVYKGEVKGIAEIVAAGWQTPLIDAVPYASGHCRYPNNNGSHGWLPNTGVIEITETLKIKRIH